MFNALDPEYDEFGNIKDLDIPDYLVIEEKDPILVVVRKQESQFALLERRCKRECST